MEIPIFIIVVGAGYCSLLFFDFFFKSCMHYPYHAFLRGTGLKIKFGRIQWYTTALNRIIIKWVNRSPKLLSYSFDVGVYVALLIMPATIILCVVSWIIEHLQSKDKSIEIQKASSYMQLELMLPGINLPLNEINYYILSLAVCSIFHELGHAFAAVLEDVPVLGFGLHILLVLPVAHTDIGTDHLSTLRLWKRLRIYCAGIWHNILLAVLCAAFVILLPFFLYPFFETSSGVIVTSVSDSSVVGSSKGLNIDDIVTEINDCPVENLDEWFECLVKSMHQRPAYCIGKHFIREHEETVVDHIEHLADNLPECCDPSNQKTLCFEHIIEDITNSDLPQFLCLDVRNTIESRLRYCKYRNAEEFKECSPGVCVKPILNNSTTIIHMKRRNIDTKDFIYIGHPADISISVKVSNFIPKTGLVGPDVAEGLMLFLKYCTVFSFGLAIVNAMPCFGFDGQHIVTVLIHQLPRNVAPEINRHVVSLVINCLGTILFLFILLRSLILSFFY